MEIHVMPKDALSELLLFLAENEEFESVKNFLVDGFTVQEVKGALRELAEGLRKEASQEAGPGYNAQKDGRLTKEAKEIISYLSPGEEKSLLTAFGLVEKTKTAIHSNSTHKSK